MIPDFCTIGGTTLDWIVTAEGEYSLRRCGGNALYSAVGAWLWNKRVAIVSRVGSDFPPEFLDSFAEAGFDVSGVKRLDEQHELVFSAHYTSDGGRAYFRPHEYFAGQKVTDPAAREEHILFYGKFDAQVAMHFDPAPDEIPAHFWEARGFHVGGMRYPTQLALSQELNARNKLFTIDPQPATDAERRHNLLHLVPILLPSESEVAVLVGQVEPEQALELLAEYGARVVVIKLGPLGSLVYDCASRKRRHVPVYPVNAKDPTGAGDAYCGGFLVGYAETGDAFESALRATISSSFVIEEFDARYALQFSRRVVDARLNQLRAQVA